VSTTGINAKKIILAPRGALESRLIDPWKYLVWIFEELPKAKVSADTFAPNRVRPHSLSRDIQGLPKNLSQVRQKQTA
jgi:hypothetical protein